MQSGAAHLHFDLLLVHLRRHREVGRCRPTNTMSGGVGPVRAVEFWTDAPPTAIQQMQSSVIARHNVQERRTEHDD
eukprot:3554170-Rhodomonas_salina.2